MGDKPGKVQRTTVVPFDNMRYLQGELRMALLLVQLSETRIKIGHRDTAMETLAAADKIYSILRQSLTGPLNVEHLTPDRYYELRLAVKALRRKLDELEGSLLPNKEGSRWLP